MYDICDLNVKRDSMINDILIHTFPFSDNYGGLIHISNAFRLQSYCLCDNSRRERSTSGIR